MRGGSGTSWTRSLLSFAAAVLLAGWAINTAARLVVAVWPVVVGAVLVVVLALGLFQFVRNRDRW